MTAASTQRAFDGTIQPEAEDGHDYTMATPVAKTGMEFCLGLIGPAALSVAASRIAVDKATDAATREFANFEPREAVAVVGILKELNVPAPPMDPGAKAFIESLQTSSAGSGFDKAYATAELANHEFLRDLAKSYLENVAGNASDEETLPRHLAALAITAFKEHVVLTKSILRRLS
ncbi:hypothetical protein BH11ARM2_BH11ARM2_28900 [soil metagenome]